MAILSAAAIACGDDDPTAMDDDALVGTWVATSAVFTSIADPSQSVEAIGMVESLTLEVRADDTATLTTVSGGVSDVQTGTISLAGDRLDITLNTGSSFDFGTGDEPAIVDISFMRS